MCADTVSGVQRFCGDSGSMVKPSRSMLIITPGLVGLMRAKAAALGDLGRMPGGRHVGAAHQREGGEHRGVGGAPAENDVGAGVDGGDVGLRAQERDDVAAGVQGGVARTVRPAAAASPGRQRCGP